MRVTSFRVSILRDRRVVLYAGFRSGEYHAPLCYMAWNQSLFGPATQPLGRVCMTTPHPYLHSSLPIATCSTGRSVGSLLVAFLPRFQHGVTSPMPRGSAVSLSPERRELMVGESRCIISLAWTHSGQRSHDLCRSSPTPCGVVSSERVAHTACSRHRFAALYRGTIWLCEAL